MTKLGKLSLKSAHHLLKRAIMNGNSFRKLDIYKDLDSHSYRTFEIARNDNALVTLQKYFGDLSHGRCSDWVVLEYCSRSHGYRIIEDHEILWDISENWKDGSGNRFIIRMDYSKYEVFRNPLQFLPLDMVTVGNKMKDTFTELSPPSQNSFLRNYLSSDQWSMEIEGWVTVLEKKSWKKSYCILRPSGLYSSAKPPSKEPQFLSLLCGLESINIYSVENARSELGAPTDFVIFLMDTLAAGESKYICLQDEESRRNWIVCLRLQKFGDRLRQNYMDSLRADRALNSLLNMKELHIQEEVRSRVPMDFSGECGRILGRPDEALEALVSETGHLRKRAIRSADSSPVSNSSFLSSQPWYFGSLSRDEAARLLVKDGSVDGVFLVRKAQGEPRAFCLSFTYGGKVHNQRIFRVKAGEQTCLTLDGNTRFPDLDSLVQFYQLNNGTLPTKLMHPVKPS